MDIEGFEWDDAKNDANQKEHNINFVQAVKAFDDELAIFLEDPEHSDENETRYALIGMIEYRLDFRFIHVSRRKLPDNLGEKSQPQNGENVCRTKLTNKANPKNSLTNGSTR